MIEEPKSLDTPLSSLVSEERDSASDDRSSVSLYKNVDKNIFIQEKIFDIDDS